MPDCLHFQTVLLAFYSVLYAQSGTEYQEVIDLGFETVLSCLIFCCSCH